MFKKFFSSFLCMAIMFIILTAVFSTNHAGYATAKTNIYETPYYYNQLNDNAKTTYKTLKEAVLNCEKSVKLRYDCSIDKKDFEQIAELLIFHDPMTFNLKDIEVSAYNNSIRFNLVYRYDKNTYDKMTEDYKREAEKILSDITDDMSVYKKIRIIHDGIINSAVYDLNSEANDTIYGTLVKKKGKCDGYSKSFSYICGQAGIRTVTVIGDDKMDNSDSMHMWNKVYYNKKWYNVDVTWDDPVGDLKDNLQYDFFMVSDNDLKNTHSENNFSFDVPVADDDSKNYFTVNKKCAEDFDSGKEMLKKGLMSAADKKKARVSLKCSSEEAYKEMKDYIMNSQKISGLINSVNKNTKNTLISGIYSYKFNDNQHIVNLYVFYENSDLNDYFINTDKVSEYNLKALAKFGIE